MDEKKVREAIEEFEIEKQTYEDMISYCKHFEPKNNCGRYEDKIAMCKTAIEALEKQLPKKPIEYEDKYYACPACGNVLMHKWEKYPTILKDKKNGLPCCLSCLQVIDWSEE